METAIYIMALLGCGEGPAPCVDVRILETRYESRQSCLAATETQLLRAGGDIDYPVVVAHCRSTTSAVERPTGEEVLLPEGGTLPARPAARPARQLAARR
jgi:hypothetical protein